MASLSFNLKSKHLSWKGTQRFSDNLVAEELQFASQNPTSPSAVDMATILAVTLWAEDNAFIVKDVQEKLSDLDKRIATLYEVEEDFKLSSLNKPNMQPPYSCEKLKRIVEAAQSRSKALSNVNATIVLTLERRSELVTTLQQVEKGRQRMLSALHNIQAISIPPAPVRAGRMGDKDIDSEEVEATEASDSEDVELTGAYKDGDKSDPAFSNSFASLYLVLPDRNRPTAVHKEVLPPTEAVHEEVLPPTEAVHEDVLPTEASKDGDKPDPKVSVSSAPGRFVVTNRPHRFVVPSRSCRFVMPDGIRPTAVHEDVLSTEASKDGDKSDPNAPVLTITFNANIDDGMVTLDHSPVSSDTKVDGSMDAADDASVFWDAEEAPFKEASSRKRSK
ncbi:hypothetical protein OPT61_g8591 [Boeremia exigua]|uniref:Uncharacterized protein n=1 Tax=Boeremia exigua TaxID=749465 RepID=A0ACC2HYH9_9PLEO|nr:hypothetical protein OPT61_g8591 [Boeremia exigua]